MTQIKMTAKFDGRCRKCGGAIVAGQPILFARGSGAVHADDETCRVAGAAAQHAQSVELHLNGSGIVALLERAKAHGLRVPKVRFLAPDGRSELRLHVAGDKSKYPGSVQVKIVGQFANAWVGRIEPDGNIAGPMRTDTALLGELEAIAADPAGKAAAYGALMGKCSFCGLPLTDAGSVEVGYGPICAKHYNLPHRPKGTPAVREVA